MAYTITPINDRDTWDEFIGRFSPVSLFQSFLWGNVLSHSGHSMWRFGLNDGRTLQGVASIVKVNAKRGTFLHIRHGPIFTSQKEGYWKFFLTFIRKFARNEKASFVRISPLLEATAQYVSLMRTLGFIPSPVHAMDAELCWVLDIDQPEDVLLASMRKTTRYEVRRAEKLGVTVRVSTELEDLDAFLRLYKETAKRRGFVAHEGVAEEFEVFGRENRAIILLGLYEGTLLAGALILFSPHQAIYHHGASMSTKIPASYLVQWRAIREAKKRGLKLYNFWGIAPEDNPNHPWRGLTLFKKGFGGRTVSFLHAQDLVISSWYAVPRIVEVIEERIRGY